MEVEFMDWEDDTDVCGEAAALIGDGRFLDLVVTPTTTGAVWDVIDGTVRIASAIATTVAEAKNAALAAGRRALMRAV